MEVSYVRIGQLSDAETNGYWNVKENFPVMVKLLQEIHAFPRLNGVSLFLSGYNVIYIMLIFPIYFILVAGQHGWYHPLRDTIAYGIMKPRKQLFHADQELGLRGSLARLVIKRKSSPSKKLAPLSPNAVIAAYVDTSPRNFTLAKTAQRNVSAHILVFIAVWKMESRLLGLALCFGLRPQQHDDSRGADVGQCQPCPTKPNIQGHTKAIYTVGDWIHEYLVDGIDLPEMGSFHHT
jgi:hypothetical protein